MKRTFIFVSLLVALSLLLSACGAGASNHLAAIKKAGVIKVGTSADYPPFESVDANGNKVGFDVDLMTARRLSIEPEGQAVRSISTGAGKCLIQ